MNVNFHISRYTALMIIVAVLFIFVVVRAFTYLPENQDDAILLENAKNKLTDVILQQNKDNVQEDNVEKEDSQQIKVNSKKAVNAVDKMLESAEEDREDANYKQAFSTYVDIINMTADTHICAICYDGISKIYAEQNNYGKAIEKAELAYKYEPNDSRKLTLARLYHKIGDTEHEKILVNELLENNN